jgi:uncharacterized protein (TIGR02145 family)
MKKRYGILIYQMLFLWILILAYGCKKNDDDDDYRKETNITKDIDGNYYLIATIGSQTWMVENLKTTLYRNGDPIQNDTNNADWKNDTLGAFCDYNNDTELGRVYGHLYNWYAVNDSRKLAPDGWHIPDDEEWTTLITYLGGTGVAGRKMKAPGTFMWEYQNDDPNYASAFNALPGGVRRPNGIFTQQGTAGEWWSATEYNDLTANNIALIYSQSYVYWWTDEKNWGYSVRCLRDYRRSNQ